MTDTMGDNIYSALSDLLPELKRIAAALKTIAAHFSATTSTKEN